ncbi:hypothetical protein C475_19458 [Halosimplex carlsbadense 2-9-1]|uniref:Uncharacterized protein n=1 Tax=Halosimplex carlsbadense 2-9-1 TaxID=797114 RepID=M0CFZ1_9EURY|nr:hypothetical protein C475_19458 [Halosimplex carlsbadense 2-9-1]
MYRRDAGVVIQDQPSLATAPERFVDLIFDCIGEIPLNYQHPCWLVEIVELAHVLVDKGIRNRE